jgi:branched-subunit amino acid transport protein
MDYLVLTIYLTFFTLIFLFFGYSLFYNHRVIGVSQKLGIRLPSTLRRFLGFVTLIAFASLIVIGFFLMLSIPQATNEF